MNIRYILVFNLLKKKIHIAPFSTEWKRYTGNKTVASRIFTASMCILLTFVYMKYAYKRNLSVVII